MSAYPAWMAVGLVSLVVTILLLRPSRWTKNPRFSNVPLSVQVVVLGDVGRSPRMQYHALSLAKHGCFVQLIGYFESEPLPDLLNLPNVVLVSLSAPPPWFQTGSKLLFFVLGPLKVLFQTASLFSALAYGTRAAEWLIVQNPPSIPTLMVAVLACGIRKTKLIIDWHNLGYSLLALKLGNSHPFVSISKAYERAFARAANVNIAVTQALGEMLRDEFGVRSPVFTLHDRPAKHFRPLSHQERQDFLSRHPLTSPSFGRLSTGRQKLVISSTSWTTDEDFSMLLDSLCDYSAAARSTHSQLPELLVIITGKGPRKDFYLQQIHRLQKEEKLQTVDIKTAWLSLDEYATLLASSDLGVSLHTSSSGIDLPMKVVDMFGAGLPVLGYGNFQAWSELVKEDFNGKSFTKQSELVDALVTLFDPSNTTLNSLREGALQESNYRWDEEWDSVAGQFFRLIAE